MTKEEYKEMVKDIVNNGAEYEYKCFERVIDDTVYAYDKPATYEWTKWLDFDITIGFHEKYEYRKKQSKTWMERHLDRAIFVDADREEITDFIDAFFKEYIKRVKKYEKTREVEDEEHMFIRPCELKSIAKEMGITLEK